MWTKRPLSFWLFFFTAVRVFSSDPESGRRHRHQKNQHRLLTKSWNSIDDLSAEDNEKTVNVDYDAPVLKPEISLLNTNDHRWNASPRPVHWRSDENRIRKNGISDDINRTSLRHRHHYGTDHHLDKSNTTLGHHSVLDGTEVSSIVASWEQMPFSYQRRLADAAYDANGSRLPGKQWSLIYQGSDVEMALNNTSTNITSQVGGRAFLPCRVGHLGDRQISWIRRRDWHVLTSADVLYTHDKRFSVLHEPRSHEWTLLIKWVTTKDSGTYECQVSTGTGIISLFVNLEVMTPEAHITGQGHYHINRGSPVFLTCLILKSPAPPHYVFWYQNGKQLNFLRDRPEVEIQVERTATVVDDDLAHSLAGKPVTVSRLKIKGVEDKHSGNYTCSAPNTTPASVQIFVSEGDKTAAVQGIDSAAFELPPTASLIILRAAVQFVFR